MEQVFKCDRKENIKKDDNDDVNDNKCRHTQTHTDQEYRKRGLDQWTSAYKTLECVDAS